MKKKFISFALAFVMLFSMTGCEEVLDIIIEELENSMTQDAGESQGNHGGTTTVEGTCKVHFIDVDQGDSILVESQGEYMLIDAGENDQGEVVVDYLESLGITHLDYIIGTHPHSDHIGGMDTVLDAVSVDKAILPNTTYDTKTYRDVLEGIEEQKAEVIYAKVGDTYTVGAASFIIVAPAKDDYTDPNDWSVGIKLVCGESSFIMIGDAEAKAEKDVLATGIDLEADVLKCGHHGSNTSTSDAFLKAVNPTYAVLSCGVDNKYGHPHAEILAKLEDDDVQMYRTDLLGTIIATTDGKDISWTYVGKKTTGSEDAKDDETTYILNTNGKKFHLEGCAYASRISDENRDEFTGRREQLIKDGYEACGTCNP